MRTRQRRKVLVLALLLAAAAFGVRGLQSVDHADEVMRDDAVSETTPAQEAGPALLSHDTADGVADAEDAGAHVRGRIIDVRGKPVPGMLVRVDGLQLERIACDEQARFDITGLEMGKHSLVATDEQGSGVGEHVEIDVVSNKRLYDVQLVVPRPWPLAGVVVDGNGDPVPALRIEFQHASGRGFARGGTLTDASGRFQSVVWEAGAFFAKHRQHQLKGVCEAGREDLSLVYESSVASDMLVRIVGPDGALVPKVMLTVSTGTKTSRGGSVFQVEGGMLRLIPASWGIYTEIHAEYPRNEQGQRLPLVGRVLVDVDRKLPELVIRLRAGRSVRGTVVREDGTPVEGITVIASDPSQPHANSAAGSAVSDEAGHFEMSGLPPGDAAFAARTQGTVWSASPIVVAGPDEDVVSIRLLAGIAFLVTVQDAEGRAVEGAPVSASWTHNKRWGRKQAKTDSKGEATLNGVPAGVFIDVRVDTYGLPRPLPGFDGRGIPSNEGHLSIQLPAAIEVRGTVIGPDGKPFSAGEVIAVASAPRNFGYADRVRPDPLTGAFVLGRVLPGTYRAWVQQDKITLASSEPVEFSAPATDLHLVVAPTVSVSGKLHVEDPQTWSVTWSAQPVGAIGTIGVQGHFKLSGVRDGPGHLFATRQGDPRLAVLESVRPSEGPFDLRPKEGGRIAGRITGLDRSAERQIFVKFRRGPLQFGGGIVDENGRFDAFPVPLGTWTLEVWDGALLVASKDGVDTDTTDVSLEMPRHARRIVPVAVDQLPAVIHFGQPVNYRLLVVRRPRLGASPSGGFDFFALDCASATTCW